MAALKYSRQRQAIKEFLMTRKDHPSADVVYENIKKVYPNISLGTVYRNLSLLAEIGEIQKLTGLTGSDHFDARTECHCHFVCTQCSKVIDIEDTGIEQFVKSVGKHFDGKIMDCNASFSGVCAQCLGKSIEKK